MRALRDMNMPKFVYEDVPLFLGLITDLFPGLDCPRVRYPKFNDAVEATLQKNKYILLEHQVLANVRTQSCTRRAFSVCLSVCLVCLRQTHTAHADTCSHARTLKVRSSLWHTCQVKFKAEVACHLRLTRWCSCTRR